jgi:hypothetical protein
MADTKKLPDDVYATIESGDNSAEKKEAAKKELKATDTVGRKAKAIVEDAVAGLGKVMPGYSSLSAFKDREFGKATKEHNEKVKSLKEEVSKRAGGMISSASKRADGCAVRGKTKGRMV